ncbi:MAG: hypothetical protein VX278_19765 [Myxococcota bacterium]|nr:hypothetical protein [Myxococcota bacterium]
MRSLFRVGIILLGSGCISVKTADTDSDTGVTGVESGTATVADIQQGIIGDGADVFLERVVITTTDWGEGFFVQDPGGGEWSGIYVYTETMGGEYSPIIGDEVQISGTVSEFYDYTELVVSSAENISVVGDGEVVATPVSNVTDWEPYEGCFVSLSDQTVVSSVSSYGEVELSGGIKMDNLFFDFGTEYGATYSAIQGVISYSYEEFKINPRSESDLEGYVAGEGGDVMTISDIQQGGVIGPVQLEGVVVTTEMAEEGFWVQDLGGGEWSGIYVYTAQISDTVSVNVGDVLNLTGEVSEFYDLTEITVTSLGDIEVVGTGETAVTTSVSSAPSDWESYEGVLIALENAEIVEELDYGNCSLNYNGIILDDELYRYEVSAGDVFPALTGVVTYSYGEFKLYPRDESDMSGSTNNGGGNNGGNDDGPAETATIRDIQSGTIAVGTNVEVSGAVVTGVSESGAHVFVQDPNESEYAGVMLYLSSGGVTVGLGDEVSFSGSVDEFESGSGSSRTNIELSAATDITVTGTGTIAPVELSADPSDWELYEGMLVSLSAVTLDSDMDMYGVSGLSTYSVSLDSTLFDYSTVASNGSSFTTVVGIIDDYYGMTLLPRNGGDFVQ